MLAKLISKMDRSRFEQTIACLGARGSMAEGLEADGATVIALNLRRNPITIFEGFRELRRLARKLQPNWIQGWMVHGNLMANLIRSAAPKARLAWNVRHTLDNLENERVRTRALIRLSSWASKRPDLILSNSVAGAEDHETIGYPASKRRVIPNGFDLERFRPNLDARTQWRKQLGIAADAIVIGNSARYHPMKHQTQLIKAASELPEIHVVMMGRWVDGNEQLLDLAAELGVTSRVHLLGHQSAVEDVYAALDIFCLCSQAAEGFPTAVGEAMACGVPTVTTDVGDAALIVGDTGFVVPPRDFNALVSALREMIEELKTAREPMGEACRKRICDNFALAKIIAEYESLYASSEASF